MSETHDYINTGCEGEAVRPALPMTVFTTPPCSTEANELITHLWRLAEAILPDEAKRFEGGQGMVATDKEAFVSLLLGLSYIINDSGLCDNHRGINVRRRIDSLYYALRHFGYTEVAI